MSKKQLSISMRYLGLTAAALVMLAPLILGLWASLLPTALIAKGDFLNWHISMANYGQALFHSPVLTFMLNSFVVATIIMVGHLIFCSLAAYVFAFLEFPFKRLSFVLFLSTMMLPFEAKVIPNFETIKWLNWLNSYPGLTVPFLTSAFGTFMLRQAFLRVPHELHEYSEIVGFGHWRFFTKVALPYCRTSLITLAIYTFLNGWNHYLWPLVTTFSDQMRPVQVGLKQLQSEDTFNNWGVIMATSMIVVIPTLLILLIGQKYFKTGLNEGGVKS